MEENLNLSKKEFWVAILIAVIVGIFLGYWYANRKDLSVVYACPDPRNTVTCYRVEADTSNEEGYFYVSRIYFKNEGSLSFGYCEDESGWDAICFPEDTDDDRVFYIDIAE